MATRFWCLGIFALSYVAVHLRFEHDLLTHGGAETFRKYAADIADGDTAAELAAGKWVYHSKALWCVLLVMLQAPPLRLRFRPALALAFAAYSVELLLLWPFRLYIGLNGILAVGLLWEAFLVAPRPPLRVPAAQY